MKVKICGVTHPEDAERACLLGADYIGMIFTARSKRHVSRSVAKSLSEISRAGKVEPVGVFVEQNADQIMSICEATGIKTVQLQGEVALRALPLLLSHYSLICAIGVEKKGIVSRHRDLPSAVVPLYDHAGGGTGEAFDWKAFSPPQNTPWILAGGLHPGNIAEALSCLKPYGVDVATGVEFPHSIRKDPVRMQEFITAAKKAQEIR